MNACYGIQLKWRIAMSDYKKFRDMFTSHFNNVAKNYPLFVSKVSGQVLSDEYLKGFPKGTDPIHKERTEHDCNACKSFIKRYGNIVYIGPDNKLVSIWEIPDLEYPYNVVCGHLANLNKKSSISNEFITDCPKCGTPSNMDISGDALKVVTWTHLSGVVPSSYVIKKDLIDSVLSTKRTNQEVFKRSLEQISLNAAQTVLELIEQGSIYRGEESKSAIAQFIQVKQKYEKVDSADQDNWCWMNAGSTFISRIKNTAIGTLLVDITNDVDVDEAVRKFEGIMAPANYKRPTAVFTKSMIKAAEDKINELGLSDSLGRRHAHLEDISVNDVIFVDRSIKKKLVGGSLFDELEKDVVESPKNFSKVEEISIGDFLENVVPSASSIELMIENNHEPNFFNLIGPVDKTAPSLFKWPNNFSWAYNGDIADSMKQRVKAAGGKVDGVLRFSIQWNEDNKTDSDYDAHCTEPNGFNIYFGNKRTRTKLGQLDVDIMYPRGIAVENITWPDINNMQDGKYTFKVHNFSKRTGTGGFSAEIEFGGTTYSFDHPRSLRQNETVVVAEGEFSRSNNSFKIISSIPSTQSSKDIYGVKTNIFTKVKMVMLSPNHWKPHQIGNRHFFFVLDGAHNSGSPRGFFNEFLRADLDQHRKVFEALGSKMRVPEDSNQVCGLGFSSTQRNSVIVRVSSKTKRMFKLMF